MQSRLSNMIPVYYLVIRYLTAVWEENFWQFLNDDKNDFFHLLVLAKKNLSIINNMGHLRG